MPTTPTPSESITAHIIEGANTEEGSLAALGGVLGGLSVILAILLVGVVIGWVWSHYRIKQQLQKR
jgi:uncharacterized membrane protein SpoIIM required for sporulation